MVVMALCRAGRSGANAWGVAGAVDANSIVVFGGNSGSSRPPSQKSAYMEASGVSGDCEITADPGVSARREWG